uniref:Uncharacterized protein n=1 Tax=Laticauda laticaudata TaxID=8630 RepID=A0A8C5WQI9_LATLA
SSSFSFSFLTWLSERLIFCLSCFSSPFFFSTYGMAVGFSNRCWSSSRFEKLSLVKCSLQRKEYLVGIQLSRCTAFNHWISRFESFNGNLQRSIKAESYYIYFFFFLSWNYENTYR